MAIMHPMKRPMQWDGKDLPKSDRPGHVKMPSNVPGGPGITAPWLVKAAKIDVKSK